MLPIEFLCITHRLLAQKDFSDLLAQQIGMVRR